MSFYMVRGVRGASHEKGLSSMRRKLLLGVLAGLGCVVVAPWAEAQQVQRGFAVNRFEASERGSDWFTNESLDLRGNFRLAAGALADYQYRPLVLYDANGDPARSIVRNQLNVNLGASAILFDRLRLSVNLPVVAFTDGHSGTLRGVGYASPPNEQGVGDLRAAVDVRLLGAYGDAATLAVGAQVWFPTGDRDLYTTDGQVRFQPRVMVAGDIGMFAYAGRAGFSYRARDEAFAAGSLGSEIVLSGAAGVRLADRKLLIGPEVFTSTVVVKDGFFEKRSTPVEGIFGAHYRAGPIHVGGGAGAGLTRGFGSPEFRALLTLEYQTPIDPDTDGDGILDSEDACKTVKGIRSADPAKNGCPKEEPKDRDGDGILDVDDACPDVPGVATQDRATNGCPPPADRDKDGILDPVDACPDVPGLPNEDPALRGCPDSDGDGVFDKVDACPNEAGLKTDDPKTNGCPDNDRDKDGIENKVDACPDEPGKPDPDPKKNGCPKAFVSNGEIKIIDQVKFKTSSADILPGKDSEEVLQAVLGVMKAHPEIKNIRVEGHTDDTGGAALNKKLSAARAASVVKWLTKNGIEAAKLKSEGFGPARPIDSNATEEGKRNNRRVEFHIEDPGAATPGVAK